MVECMVCQAKRERFQAATYDCAMCGVSLAVCFGCADPYAKLRWAVDAHPGHAHRPRVLQEPEKG